jgi:hypothetical protein
MLLQGELLLGDRGAATGLSARLACVAHLVAYPGSGSSCIARHLRGNGDQGTMAGAEVSFGQELRELRRGLDLRSLFMTPSRHQLAR